MCAGFLRSYAEALGLDGQPFVDEYNSRFAVGDDDVSVRVRRVPQPRSRDRGPRESRIAVLALLGIAVITALVIAAWRFGGPESECVPGLGQCQSPTGTVGGRRKAVHGSSCAPTTAAPGWRCARAPRRGRLLYSGTLEKGQRKEFDGAPAPARRSRSPSNVVVRLNGNRKDLPDGTAFTVTSRRIVPASS